MTLESQVCSLELAQKLKELGVKQESFFKWGNTYSEGKLYWDLYVPPEFNKIPHPDLWVHGVAAFTVAELGEMLPWRIEKGERFYVLECEKGGKPWYWVNYKYGDTRHVDFDCFTQEADTEAEARAKMLIYLLENNLITL